MKLLRLLLALVISIVINAQAFALTVPVRQSTQSSDSKIHVASTNQMSRNWSGYTATDGNFTGVNGTWQIPKSSARNYGIDATWVGIGGVNSDDLIQAGTQAIVQEDGKTMYEAFYEVLPDPSQQVNLDVHENDVITASVMKKEGSTWQISIENNTTGQKKQFAVSYSSSLSSANWIEEAPSGERNILPLDNFGTVNFSNASTIKNGDQITLSEANAQAMHMGESMGKILAVASDIGNDGQSFSVSRTSTSDSQQSSYHYHMRGFGSVPFFGNF